MKRFHSLTVNPLREMRGSIIWNDQEQSGMEMRALMELVQGFAPLKACLQVVRSSCLSHGIRVRTEKGGTLPSPEFKNYVERYYTQFCEDACLYFFACGFVPYVLQKTKDGLRVPRVIPFGTFSWKTVISDKGVYTYDVRASGMGDADLHVFEYNMPSVHSNHLQTPLLPAIRTYIRLQRCEDLHDHVDQWNAQAKLVCSYQEKDSVYKLNESGVVSGYDDCYATQIDDDALPKDAEGNQRARDAITEALVGEKETGHSPIIYTLPKNSVLQNYQAVRADINVQEMRRTLIADVCNCFGVPVEMISGGYDANKSQKISLDNSRVFVCNMTGICRHLQELLRQVYETTFKEKTVKVTFELAAVPRIDIADVDELIRLYEVGLLGDDYVDQVMRALTGHQGGASQRHRKRPGDGDGEQRPKQQQQQQEKGVKELAKQLLDEINKRAAEGKKETGTDKKKESKGNGGDAQGSDKKRPKTTQAEKRDGGGKNEGGKKK